jgi:hypothetical protein
MFKKNKKLAAAILTAALALSSVSVAFAAGSPTTGIPESGEQKVDPTKQNTTEVTVNDGTGITATKVADVAEAVVGGKVKVNAVGGGTIKLPVDTLGTKALEDNTRTTKLTTTSTVTKYKKNALAGSKVKTVVAKVNDKNTLTLESKSLANCDSLTTFTATGKGTVEFCGRLFSKTKVSNVTVKCPKLVINQGSFYGIEKGNKTLIQLTGVKKAKNLKVSVGAFGSNSRNMTIRFSAKMSSKEYKKAVKKLRNGGFKGRIIRSKKTK